MIDFILWIFNEIVNVIVKLLPYLGGLSLLAILLVVSIPYLKKMISVPQIIKKHADALIGAVVIFILILPFTLWKSGYYGKDKLFANADTLGYYGALIGGGVTVLGVYWTLNYESKKSKEEREYERQNVKEERRKNSLPILQFEFSPKYFTLEEIKEKSYLKDIHKGHDIVIDTTEESEKPDENSIHEFGKLEIFNVGLGAAIISEVKLIRGKSGNVVNNSSDKGYNRHIIVPQDKKELFMTIISNDFNKEDTLYLAFVDLYSNEYYYEIPFNNMKKNPEQYKTKIDRTDTEIIPNLVSTKN
jgi:hypothetical protein